MYNLCITINGLDYNNTLWISKKYYQPSEFNDKVNSISLKIQKFIEDHYNYNIYIPMINDLGVNRKVLFKDADSNKIILDLYFSLQVPYVSIDPSMGQSIYTSSAVYGSSLWDKFNDEICNQVVNNSKYKYSLEDFDQWRRL